VARTLTISALSQSSVSADRRDEPATAALCVRGTGVLGSVAHATRSNSSTDDGLRMSVQRYWHSAAGARGSAATDAAVSCNAELDGGYNFDRSSISDRMDPMPQRFLGLLIAATSLKMFA